MWYSGYLGYWELITLSLVLPHLAVWCCENKNGEMKTVCTALEEGKNKSMILTLSFNFTKSNIQREGGSSFSGKAKCNYCCCCEEAVAAAFTVSRADFAHLLSKYHETENLVSQSVWRSAISGITCCRFSGLVCFSASELGIRSQKEYVRVFILDAVDSHSLFLAPTVVFPQKALPQSNDRPQTNPRCSPQVLPFSQK